MMDNIAKSFAVSSLQYIDVLDFMFIPPQGGPLAGSTTNQNTPVTKVSLDAIAPQRQTPS